jgi:hypothetical protein
MCKGGVDAYEVNKHWRVIHRPQKKSYEVRLSAGCCEYGSSTREYSAHCFYAVSFAAALVGIDWCCESVTKAEFNEILEELATTNLSVNSQHEIVSDLARPVSQEMYEQLRYEFGWSLLRAQTMKGGAAN